MFNIELAKLDIIISSLWNLFSSCSLVKKWPVNPVRLSSSQWGTSPLIARWDHICIAGFIQVGRMDSWNIFEGLIFFFSLIFFHFQIKYKTNEPIWEEAFTFLIHNPKIQELEIDVREPDSVWNIYQH